MSGRPAGAALSLAGLLLAFGLGGCDSAAVPEPPAAPSPEPPPPTRLSGDYRTSLRCAGATIEASDPERLSRPGRFPSFVVDVAVTARASDAAILDLLRPYDTAGWRVRREGDAVRHDLRVYWNPMDGNFLQRASDPGKLWPMTLAACPEGERGPVLACTETSCAVYENEAAVPEAIPESVGLVLRSPWGLSDVQEVREGESLSIPISYEAVREVESAILRAHLGPIYGQTGDWLEDAELAPASHEGGPWRAGDTGTWVFVLTALEDRQVERFREVIKVHFTTRGPVAAPNDVTVLIRDSP